MSGWVVFGAIGSLGGSGRLGGSGSLSSVPPWENRGGIGWSGHRARVGFQRRGQPECRRNFRGGGRAGRNRQGRKGSIPALP
jgi:hypothetical protein